MRGSSSIKRPSVVPPGSLTCPFTGETLRHTDEARRPVMDQPPGGAPPPGGPRAPDWGEMKGKLAAAKGPERLILIGGLLFFIDSFLPWYGVSGSIAGIGFSANAKGWSSGGLAVIAILLGLAATL